MSLLDLPNFEEKNIIAFEHINSSGCITDCNNKLFEHDAIIFTFEDNTKRLLILHNDGTKYFLSKYYNDIFLYDYCIFDWKFSGDFIEEIPLCGLTFVADISDNESVFLLVSEDGTITTSDMDMRGDRPETPNMRRVRMLEREKRQAEMEKFRGMNPDIQQQYLEKHPDFDPYNLPF